MQSQLTIEKTKPQKTIISVQSRRIGINMKQRILTDSRVSEITAISSPAQIVNDIPQSEASAETVVSARENIKNIVKLHDDRLLVIVGPCSIHDTKAALEYAEWLKTMRQKYSDGLEIVMRTYLEKPRTTVGWKGIVNDPHMDDSFDIEAGLRISRELLHKITSLGVPVSTELLDLRTPQYTADLISWGAIGARTVESQSHRELTSGVSFPVGFKNGTGGNIQIAIDAMHSASTEHNFLGIDMDGQTAIIKTKGNNDTHIILRGSTKGPNYDQETVENVSKMLVDANQNPSIMIDCSHANSKKDHNNQPIVASEVARQVAAGNNNITGVMIESNLVEGNQKLVPGKELVYGQSITDACVNTETTAQIFETLSESVKQRRA